MNSNMEKDMDVEMIEDTEDVEMMDDIPEKTEEDGFDSETKTDISPKTNSTIYDEDSTDKYNFTEEEGDGMIWENCENESVNFSVPFHMDILRSSIEQGEGILEKVQGQHVVLIVGKTGVGKSLFLQGIAGKQIIKEVHETSFSGETISTDVFAAVDALPGSEIGHDKVSKTRSINCFVRQNVGKSKEDIVYLDSPGWDDTAGPEVDIATAAMFSQVAKRARSLRIVVLIKYGSLLEDRGGALRAVLKLAHTFVSDFDQDKTSFMFLFTHINEIRISGSLEEAKASLKGEIFRISKDAHDPDLKDILAFIRVSLAKNFGFVDVLHPLKSDFKSLTNFIETELSLIQNPATVVNCSLTVQSQMKLKAEMQRLLETLRGLLRKEGPQDAQQLKHIRKTFQYFHRNIEVCDVQKAFNECEELFKKHIDSRRLILEEELQKSAEGSFGIGSVQILKTSTLQMEAIVDEYDSTHIRQRMRQAFQVCYDKVMSTRLENMGETLQELDKLKAWSEGFDHFVEEYKSACHQIGKIAETIASEMQAFDDTNFEYLCEEKIPCCAQRLIILESVSIAQHKFLSHGIGIEKCLIARSKMTERLSLAAVCWADAPAVPAQSESWEEAQSHLQQTTERAKKLEVWHTLLQGGQILPHLVQKLAKSLETMESNVVLCLRAFPVNFGANQQSLPNHIEQKFDALSAIDSTFSSFSSGRWKEARQVYRQIIDDAKSTVRAKFQDLDFAARLCNEKGLVDGHEDGQRFCSFKSHVGLDKYFGDRFVHHCCAAVLIMYRSRMQVVIDEARQWCLNLRVASPENTETLKKCHKAMAEIKEFELFETEIEIDGDTDSLAQQKKKALEGLPKYKTELQEKTEKWSSEWVTLLKEKKLEEAHALTKMLDNVLAEIETIKAFSCMPGTKKAATTSQKHLQEVFKQVGGYAEEAFRNPGEYQKKAEWLACMAKINGFKHTDPYLPRFSDYKEKARRLVSDHAINIERQVEQSVDQDKVDELLKAFQFAKVLDPYISDEASNRLRPLQSLRKRKIEQTDMLLDDMIDREDFKGIGEFLSPMKRSKDSIIQHKFRKYARAISEKMKDQADSAQARLRMLRSKEDAAQIADAMKIMEDADKEIGSLILSEDRIRANIERLQGRLNSEVETLADSVVSGATSCDFVLMGNSHYLLFHLFKNLEPFLNPRIKMRYKTAISRWEDAFEQVPKTVDNFVDSLFKNDRRLEKVLSSLKIASESQEPKLIELQKLYDDTVSNLSTKSGTLLKRVREWVEKTGCYDDGIAVLQPFNDAQARGLEEHMRNLPFNCDHILTLWEKEQKKDSLDTSGSDAASVLDDCNKKLDKLKDPWRFERFLPQSGLTLRRICEDLNQHVRDQFGRGTSSLQERDIVPLQKSLNMLVLMDKKVSKHIPEARTRRKMLEDMIIRAFKEICDEAVGYLGVSQRCEAVSLINFQSIFPDLHNIALHFLFVLDQPEARKKFCLVNQLVHDVLENGISKLNEALSNHNFLEARTWLIYNRTHGAFLSDHYSLLFEELKQRGKLDCDEWLGKIWKVACGHYFEGRDLSNIRHFAILGVVPSASEDEIRKAFKKIALQVHPDKKSRTNGDAGEEFRKAKDALDTIINSAASRETSTTPQPFDSVIQSTKEDLIKSVQDYLCNQRYDLMAQLLEKLPDYQVVCALKNPPVLFEETRASVIELVEENVKKVRVEVNTYWDERKFKDLNQSIDDIRQMEKNLKPFPDVFPESWNQGIIRKVEAEIDSLGKTARSLLKNKQTAVDCVHDFRRCFLQMGAVLVELQMFKNYTKNVMDSVLESCLKSDWGYSYLFELGLSFHRGDESNDGEGNIIGQALLSEFSHFKEVMTMVWNEETAQKPAEDTVRDITGVQMHSQTGATAHADIDHDALLESFRSFEVEYQALLGEFLSPDSDNRALAKKTIALADTLKPLSCTSIWDLGVKRKLPLILAGVFALFTIVKSGDSFNRIQASSTEQDIGQKLLMKPHNIQVLTLLHLLGCGKKSDTSLESQLMQIRTGEGKSIILGAAASVLGLLGFNIRCVCYSEYLSERDFSLFEEVFLLLGLDKHVVYSKITTLSEDTTAQKGDIRGLTKDLLQQTLIQRQTSYQRLHKATKEKKDPKQCIENSSLVMDYSKETSSTSFNRREEILLVDEVDVFFGSDFYGQTYNQVMELREPEIADILSDIWAQKCRGGRKQRLSDVQATQSFRRLVQKMPLFEFLINNEIRLMLDHVHRIEEEPYYLDAANNQIGYKVLDTISYQVTYGYRTVFAYLKEADSFKDKDATLKRVLVMPISCGQFSYANIAPTRILGVSGTLEVMNDYEKGVLWDYGVKDFIFVPSVYGKSNFTFDKAGDGIFIEEDKSDFFQKICDEIQSKTKKKRAVIVFFKDSVHLEEFTSSHFFSKLGRQKVVLSENMEPGEKEFVINKAATSGQITLCPAVFGRGTDFFSKDEQVQNAGGVHIIQTFLSMEKSEEVQIQGRTARQGKKGSYQLVLLETDICEGFGVSLGEKDNIPRNKRYEWLCEIRDQKHSEHWNKVEENLKLATKRDVSTHQYFDALLAGNQTKATDLFKDLYLTIKKPPVPESIGVDIALLIDITGSMAPYCQHAVSTIEGLITGNNSIASKLKIHFPETEIKLRLGILGYRDIDDGNGQFHESVWDGGCHFTESVSDILTFAKHATTNPSGGHDLAEDHLGAIFHCSEWNNASDWSSPIKMALLFTDAPAHGLVPPSSSGVPNVDGYALRHPKGLDASLVADDLLSKGINLFVCSYNPFATSIMEEKLAEEILNHPKNSEEREVKRISMVPESTGQALIGDNPNHIVFVLDESGSMSSEWAGVVKAFQEYVARRKQNQNESDLVSVVQFAHSARVTVQQNPIGSTPSTLDYRSGGTQFAPAALEASQLVASTPSSHRPTVVFMSDGGTSDAPAAASTFSALNRTVLQSFGNDLDLHVIAFGGGADKQQLQQISRSSPKGRVYLSSDTVQLTNIFVNIAGGQQVASALQEGIAKEISEAVSDTLSLEYLS